MPPVFLYFCDATSFSRAMLPDGHYVINWLMLVHGLESQHAARARSSKDKFLEHNHIDISFTQLSFSASVHFRFPLHSPTTWKINICSNSVYPTVGKSRQSASPRSKICLNMRVCSEGALSVVGKFPLSRMCSRCKLLEFSPTIIICISKEQSASWLCYKGRRGTQWSQGDNQFEYGAASCRCIQFLFYAIFVHTLQHVAQKYMQHRKNRWPYFVRKPALLLFFFYYYW